MTGKRKQDLRGIAQVLQVQATWTIKIRSDLDSEANGSTPLADAEDSMPRPGSAEELDQPQAPIKVLRKFFR